MPVETRLPMVGRGKLTAMLDSLLSGISASRRVRSQPSTWWRKRQPTRTVPRVRTVSRVSIAARFSFSPSSHNPQGCGVEFRLIPTSRTVARRNGGGCFLVHLLRVLGVISNTTLSKRDVQAFVKNEFFSSFAAAYRACRESGLH